MTKRVYFKAQGRSLATLHEFEDLRETQRKKLEELRDEFNAIEIVNRGSFIVGFTFKDEESVPEGWRHVNWIGCQKYYGPYRRKKVDKELWARIQSCKMPDWEKLTKMLSGQSLYIIDSKMTGCGYETLNDVKIISVPVDNGEPVFAPEDAVQLKMSEYWALKEDQDDD